MSLHEGFGSGNKDSTPDLKPNDLVMTPVNIAKEMIGFYEIEPHHHVLDPCKGDGAFYDNYPECTKSWCEITEGVDFLKWTKTVDWIITNPPYSVFEDFLRHALKIADNVCFLVPLAKVVSSLRRIDMILDNGGIVSIRTIGASRCGFPFGFPAAAIHMKRNYKGRTKIEKWR